MTSQKQDLSLVPPGAGAVQTSAAPLKLSTALPAEPTERRPVIPLLQHLADDAQRAGDHQTHRLLSDILVALGALREKTKAADGILDGEVGAFIDQLHAML